MADYCRRHVHQDSLPANLVGANEVGYHASHPIKPASLPAVRKGRLELADPDILEVGQRAARFEQPAISAVNVSHLAHGKVVERQPRNDDVVYPFAVDQLDGRMDQTHLIAAAPELPLGLESTFQQIDEVLVDFDQVK